MTNKKRKGFTIVELVIVIAVIAILAGVLIPTFASIIDKANQSSDIQAVRQMNVVLMAESVEDKPTDVNKVIEIVSEAGYDTPEKRTPKSSGHGFYWHRGTNLIVLVKGTSELVYPDDNEAINELFEDEGFIIENNDKFKNLATNAGSGEGGNDEGLIITAADFNDALEEGGEIKLGADITLVELVTVPVGVTTTIDLNGKELLIEGNRDGWSENGIITVQGNLTFKDSSEKNEDGNKAGNIILDAYAFDGIYVKGGHLILDGVNIIGNTKWNIKNYGKTDILNSKFVVEGGFGIANAGEAVIENCELVAKDNTTQIYTDGGTLTVKNTRLCEGEDFISYRQDASSPIYVSGSEITLDNVEVDVSTSHCAFLVGGAKLDIKSGNLEGTILCSGAETTVAIYGGTVNGVAFEDIAEDSNILVGLGFIITRGDGCWVIKNQ